MVQPKIVCVVGPTSSGKTALGIRLAKRFFGEIINGDARQLYRDAPIGTGVPALEQRESIPHHLLGVSAPDEVWTVSRWCSEAIQAVHHIQERERVPIVVGGTGMYIRAFTEGFVFEGEPSPELRKHLLLLTPTERLHRLLSHAPEAKEHIDVHNPHRVLRALERVLSGQSLLAIQKPPSFSSCKIARYFSPEALRMRIERTINQQLACGWVEEVQTLLDQGVSLHAPLMQSIGFRTIATALHDGRMMDVGLRQAIVRDTWAYARRQMTWFRKEPRLQWVQSEAEAEEYVAMWLARDM